MSLEITTPRLVASAVATFVAMLSVQKGVSSVSLILLISLVLIWFSEVLGSATGGIGHSRVDTPTPSPLIAGFGWAVLLFFASVVIRSPTSPSTGDYADRVIHPYQQRLVPSMTDAEAQREAVRRYPALGLAGSAFNRRFIARYRLYQQQRPTFFNDPSWPILLADELARESQ